MIRVLASIGLFVLILASVVVASRAVAADDAADTPCSKAGPEPGLEPASVPSPPASRPNFVAPETLKQIPSGARIFDIRQPSRRSRWQPEGALPLSLLELRVLAGRAEHPIYVFGNGYDDDQIVRRIARWKPSEIERVRVVRHGAAGIAMTQPEPIEEPELKRLLAVPVEQVAALGERAGSVLAWVGLSPAPAGLAGGGIELHDADPRSINDAAERAAAQALENDATIVLAGDDPIHVGEAATRASMQLGRPVFFMDGDRGTIKQQIDRHARLVQGRRRIGSVPCG